jgi:hypothetical protein
MKLSRNKIERLLKSGNQSRKKIHSSRSKRRHHNKNKRVKSVGHVISSSDDDAVLSDDVVLSDDAVLSDDDMVFPSNHKYRQRKAHTERAGKRQLNLRMKSLKRHNRENKAQKGGDPGEDAFKKDLASDDSPYKIPSQIPIKDLYDLLYKILYGDLFYLVRFNYVSGILNIIQEYVNKDSKTYDSFKSLLPGNGAPSPSYNGENGDVLLNIAGNIDASGNKVDEELNLYHDLFLRDASVSGVNTNKAERVGIRDQQITNNSVIYKSDDLNQKIAFSFFLNTSKGSVFKEKKKGQYNNLEDLNMLKKINMIYQSIQPQDYFYAIKDKAFSGVMVGGKKTFDEREHLTKELNGAKAQVKKLTDMFNRAINEGVTSFSGDENYKDLAKIHKLLNEKHGGIKKIGLGGDTISQDMEKLEGTGGSLNIDSGLYEIYGDALIQLINEYNNAKSSNMTILQIIRGPDGRLKKYVNKWRAAIYEVLRYMSRYVVPEGASQVKSEEEIENAIEKKNINNVVTALNSFKKNVELFNSPLYEKLEDDDEKKKKLIGEIQGLYNTIKPGVQKFIDGEKKDQASREELMKVFDEFKGVVEKVQTGGGKKKKGEGGPDVFKVSNKEELLAKEAKKAAEAAEEAKKAAKKAAEEAAEEAKKAAEDEKAKILHKETITKQLMIQQKAADDAVAAKKKAADDAEAKAMVAKGILGSKANPTDTEKAKAEKAVAEAEAAKNAEAKAKAEAKEAYNVAEAEAAEAEKVKAATEAKEAAEAKAKEAAEAYNAAEAKAMVAKGNMNSDATATANASQQHNEIGDTIEQLLDEKKTIETELQQFKSVVEEMKQSVEGNAKKFSLAKEERKKAEADARRRLRRRGRRLRRMRRRLMQRQVRWRMV